MTRTFGSDWLWYANRAICLMLPEGCELTTQVQARAWDAGERLHSWASRLWLGEYADTKAWRNHGAYYHSPLTTYQARSLGAARYIAPQWGVD